MNSKSFKNICKSVTKKIYIVGRLSFLFIITSTLKVTAQDNLDFATLKGTWKGTITSSLINSSKKTSNPITITFNSYDLKEFQTTQIFKNVEKNTIDTSEVSITGDVQPSFLHLIYQQLGEDKKNYCDVILFLKYSVKYGFKRLDGDNTSGNNNCSKIQLSLIKVSNEFKLVQKTSATSSEQSNLEKELLPAAAQLFKTVRKLPSNDEAIGEIVHLNISNEEKNSIIQKSGLMLTENDTLYIDKDNNQPYESAINVIDLNEDGEYEIVVWKHNRMGPSGSSEFTIYYKSSSGEYRNILSNYGFPIMTEVKNNNFNTIIIGGPGFRYPELFWNGNKYVFLRTISMEPKKPVDVSKLVGGSTPDELGRILLKALKTNNKQLWMNCMLPDNEKYGALCEQEFKRIRDKLEQKGLTDWSLVTFSRVTYSKEYMSSNDNGVVDGEQVRRNFVIEFYYRNKEFIGGIGSMTIQTYKNGNYLVYFPGYDAALVRYKKK